MSGEVIGGLEQRGPVVGVGVQIGFAEQRRGVTGIGVPWRVVVGCAGSRQVGERGRWRGGHGVDHDVFGRHGLNVGGGRLRLDRMIDGFERGYVGVIEAVVEEAGGVSRARRELGEIEFGRHV